MTDQKFDYVVASHVVEHIPDLIVWLQDLAQITKPDGRVFLVVPDKRYIFDIARPLTSLGEVIDNHLTGKSSPSLRDVFDQRYYSVKVNAKSVWDGDLKEKDLVCRGRLNRMGINDLAKRVREEYVDAHCNVFTSGSFRDIIDELCRFRYQPFEVVHLDDVAHPYGDFIALLGKRSG